MVFCHVLFISQRAIVLVIKYVMNIARYKIIG